MLWDRRPPAEEAGCCSEGEHLDHLSISKEKFISAVMFKALLLHSSHLTPTVFDVSIQNVINSDYE